MIFYILFFIIIAIFITRVFVIPLMRIRYYVKQGGQSDFFPLIGCIYKHYASAEQKGDFYYNQKRVKHEKNPPRFKVSNLGSQPSVILYDTQLIKAFYSNPQCYVKQISVLGFIGDLLGNGLLTAELATHKRHRKIISNVFHYEFIKSMLPAQLHFTKSRFDIIEKEGMKNVKIMDEFQKITGEIVGSIFFGEELGKQTFDGQPLTMALADLIVNISKVALTFTNFLFGPAILRYSPLPMHRKVLNDIKRFRNLCIQIVQEKRKKYEANKELIRSKEKKDMLEHLFISLEDNKADETLSEKDIIDEFITFFLAGMDTTGHLTAMAVYCLTQDPVLLDKIREEVKKIYKDGTNVTAEDLQGMDVTNAFLKECLRVYSPGPGLFPRVATQDHYLKDIHIKKGSIVTLELMTNNFAEEYFEDPFTFDPYRFAKKPQLEDPFVYIPFSSGSRNCIGQHLANMESKIILAEFVRRYDFKLKDNYKLRMTLKFLHEPVEPLELDLTKRN